jgi:hypothetical protein
MSELDDIPENFVFLDSCSRKSGDGLYYCNCLLRCAGGAGGKTRRAKSTVDKHKRYRCADAFAAAGGPAPALQLRQMQTHDEDHERHAPRRHIEVCLCN